MSHLNNTTNNPNNVNHNKDTSNNWYARLHTPDYNTAQQGIDKNKPLNLSIFFRIWLAVAVIIVISAIFVLIQLFQYIKPITQQVIESNMLDTAKALAFGLQTPLQTQTSKQTDYKKQLDEIFRLNTDDLPTRVYITNPQGVVIYDSQANYYNAIGQDYSQWNDVFLILQGNFKGVRTTKENNSNTTVMYVAQPIFNTQKQLLGVVSVGKPVSSELLKQTRLQILAISFGVMSIALILAGLVAWWLKQSIALVAHYTQWLAPSAKKPYFYLGRELNQLTDSIEDMKNRLENKGYVEDYVHTLTHELKSPLTAIRASGELLEDNDLDIEDRILLSHTITEQSLKLQTLIDRLLLLAKIEQPTFRLQKQSVNLVELLQKMIDNNQVKVQKNHLVIKLIINQNNQTNTPIMLTADKFWLEQALQNLLDNALKFANQYIYIHINHNPQDKLSNIDGITIEFINDGQPIPDFAISQVFDRYFSLPQSQNHQQQNNYKQKGTGLGLTLVKHVVEQHGGAISIENCQYQLPDKNQHTSTTPQIFTAVKVQLIFPIIH